MREMLVTVEGEKRDMLAELKDRKTSSIMFKLK